MKAPRARPAHTAGFFSSAKRMSLPVGQAFAGDSVRGYPIDMRVKALAPQWPPPGTHHPSNSYVYTSQFGLGCYERFLAGEGEEWLAAAMAVGRHLVETQEPDGTWLNRLSFPHTYPLRAPWPCGMAHGQAASLLVRLHLETGEEQLAEVAIRGLQPLWRDQRDGGVCAWLDGAPWPEEYPTDPPSFVLNGAIFAWWGMRDVAVALGDNGAARGFEEAVATLADNLHRFDTGWWSRYSLYPHPIPSLASSFYHMLHISQLEAMQALAPRPEFAQVAERWRRYASWAPRRWRALAGKVLFRVVVPRNRVLANRLPWNRP